MRSVYRRNAWRYARNLRKLYARAPDDPVFADERAEGIQDDLRKRVVSLLLDRAELITADAAALFSHSGPESLDPESRDGYYMEFSLQQERAERFHFERDRRRYAVGRGILRRLLGGYSSLPPAELRFVYGLHGKPLLPDDMLAGGFSGPVLGLECAGRVTRDHLHEKYRTRSHPQLPALLAAAVEAGAIGACLSGAGSTIIAFADNARTVEQAESALAGAAADGGLSGRIKTVAPRNEGARILGRG
jgi:hypothetical protein